MLSFAAVVTGTSLREAMTEAARYFKFSSKISNNRQIVISGIINYHSQKKDQLSKQIETEMYFAFGSQFSQVKLIDESESLAGVSGGNTVFIKGAYKQEGSLATLSLKAIKGIMTGEIIDQASVVFETQYRRRTLVAVLDIESDVLNKNQRKIISEMFRESLGEIDVFEMASSSDIDKMNPDDIQQAMGCTRDTCATVIGEQLGVDRVISNSLRKMDKDYYVISAKIMDIKDGSIVATKSVDHDGNLRKLRQSLKKLAEKLTRKLKTSVQTTQPFPKSGVPSVDGFQITTPKLSEETERPKNKLIKSSPELTQPRKTVLRVKVNNKTVVDLETGLMWQKGESGDIIWSKAKKYCEGGFFGGGLELAGYDDWRLPNEDELGSAYRIKNKFPELHSSYYWSSTTPTYQPSRASYVHFASGFMGSHPKSNSYYVRYVRGGS